MQAITLPPTLASLSAIGQFIMDQSTAAGLTGKAAYRLRLAVDEVATNTINYGYKGLATGTIDLRADIDEQTLTITLEDTAPPYNPNERETPLSLDMPVEERPIGGLGVFLALTGVDQFRYERAGDKNCNIFVMNRPR
jgi:serine/threonine-protein kinase RsbW